VPNLKTRFVRDSRGIIAGTVTSGFADGSELIKDKFGQAIGRTVPRVGTKNMNNEIVSRTSDSGFLFHFGYSTQDTDE
jgi:hypothetical protein